MRWILKSVIDMRDSEVPFNLFVPNAPFIYPLKTLENRKVEKGCIGDKLVKRSLLLDINVVMTEIIPVLWAHLLKKLVFWRRNSFWILEIHFFRKMNPECDFTSLKWTLPKMCPYSELFWSVFSRVRTEYGEILVRIFPNAGKYGPE